MILNWKDHKGIKYADSGQNFFWLIYPSGLKGQWRGTDENELKRKLDTIKIAN